jgi:cytochrome c-type biogenesis protein CcmH
MKRWMLLIAVLLLAAIPALAQNQIEPVTADEVNAIAKKMFCPVCENIPLDSCGTDACNDWRNEIRIYLEQGMTEQEIINDFVMRFGDRVVGTPQDPFLRALSIVTPWVLIGVAVMIVLRFITQWRRPEPVTQRIQQEAPRDAYREMLEKDLLG